MKECTDDINVSIKTIYTYIDIGAFKSVGVNISNIDLRRKVGRRRISKSASKNYKLKERKDRKFLVGRTYDDFKKYKEEHPNVKIVEMDTVYNDVSNGPFVQTFKFMKYHFLLCVYHESKDSNDMKQGILWLEKLLGPELLSSEVQVILTDRGSEFSDVSVEKRDDGSVRTRIFYCDPMQSGQKGSLENNHEELRYILPKGKDLKSLGFVSQEKANLCTRHINSFKKKLLSEKSPFDWLYFLNATLYEKLALAGIKVVPPTKINLKPSVLKEIVDY